VAFNLPATLAKYDIHFRSTAAGRVYLYALSMYEYET
jgi:hypothetical protein